MRPPCRFPSTRGPAPDTMDCGVSRGSGQRVPGGPSQSRASRPESRARARTRPHATDPSPHLNRQLGGGETRPGMPFPANVPSDGSKNSVGVRKTRSARSPTSSDQPTGSISEMCDSAEAVLVVWCRPRWDYLQTSVDAESFCVLCGREGVDRPPTAPGPGCGRLQVMTAVGHRRGRSPCPPWAPAPSGLRAGVELPVCRLKATASCFTAQVL